MKDLPPIESEESTPRVDSFDFPDSDFKYIQHAYHEDPESYSIEIHSLEALRAQAVHPQHNVEGVNFLKKYYCQLTFLKSRFPITREGPIRLTFTWKEAFSSTVVSSHDVRFEQLCVMFNIGSLHSKLGVMDERLTPEGLKLACTHFQCAAWAFHQLKEVNCPDIQMSSSFISFMVNTCLAQAQECVLEQSLTGNRKSIINAKVAAQIVEFYSIALNAILTISSEQLKYETNCSEVFDNKTHEGWKKYLRLKIDYYRAITLLYLGMQAEDEQKMGERVTYYDAAFDKLTESVNGTKAVMKSDITRNLHDLAMMPEAFSFTMDVIEGKRKAARNDNEYVYHEKVPPLDTLPELKGRDLVKGIPFSPNDSDISGPDIFQKLIPMKAHEAASLYSEEKAKLLRGMNAKVESLDEELSKFMNSLQLDIIGACHNEERLPQDLIDKCAEMSARPDAIQELTDAMTQLSESYHEVDAMLDEIKTLVTEEEESEKEYQEIMGPRPPSIVATDLKREMNKYLEAHKKAQESNETLHQVMNFHIANLQLLALTPAQLEKHIPPLTEIKTPESEKHVSVVAHLVSKVEEMRHQRATLVSQLRQDLHGDEITAQLVTRQSDCLETVFESALAKHNIVTNLIEKNLQAQPRILSALTSAYTACAPVRTSLAEVIQRRNSVIAALRTSHDAYEDLKNKTKRGNEFYEKLGNSVSKLLTRVKGTCKVQEEERLSLLKKENKVLPRHRKKAAESAAKLALSEDFPNPVSHSGPKLKDYLAAGGGYSKTPLRSSAYSSSYPNDYVYPNVPAGVRPTPVGSEMNVEMKTDSAMGPSYPGYDQVTQSSDKYYAYTPSVSSYPSSAPYASQDSYSQDKTYNSQYPTNYAVNPSYSSDNPYNAPTTFGGSNPYYVATSQQSVTGSNPHNYGNSSQSYGAPQQPLGATAQPIGASNTQAYGNTPQAIAGNNSQTYELSQQPIGSTNQNFGTPQQPIGANTQTYGTASQQPMTGNNPQSYGATPQIPASQLSPSLQQPKSTYPTSSALPETQNYSTNYQTTQGVPNSQYSSQQALPNSQYSSQQALPNSQYSSQQAVPNSQYSSQTVPNNQHSSTTPDSYPSYTAASYSNYYSQETPITHYSTPTSYPAETPQAGVNSNTSGSSIQGSVASPYPGQQTLTSSSTNPYSSNPQQPNAYPTSSMPVTNPTYVHSASQPSFSTAAYPNTSSAAPYPNTVNSVPYPNTASPALYPNTANSAPYPNSASPAPYPNTASPASQYNYQYTGDLYSQYPNSATSNSSQNPNSATQSSPYTYDQNSHQYATNTSQYGNASNTDQYAYGNTAGPQSQYGSSTVAPQSPYATSTPASQYGITPSQAQYGTSATSQIPYGYGSTVTPQSAYGNPPQDQYSTTTYGQSYAANIPTTAQATSVGVYQSSLTSVASSLPQNIPSSSNYSASSVYNPSSFSPYTPDPKYPSSPSYSYNSSYSNAGQPNYLQTQSSAYSPHEATASSGNYYNTPYGTQSYMLANGNSYVNTTPSSLTSPESGNVMSPLGSQNLHPANSITQQSNVIAQPNASSQPSNAQYSPPGAKSNVDLLADLDINITQSALIPACPMPASSSPSQISASNASSQMPSASQLSRQMSNLSLASGSTNADVKGRSSEGYVSSDRCSAVEKKTSSEELPAVLSHSSFTAPKPVAPEVCLDKEALTLLAQDVEILEKMVETLTSKPSSGPGPLDVKWKELNDLQAKEAGLQNISVARCYPMKNRSPDILPYDSTRVELPSTKDDYINASYIRCSSISTPAPLIVTQAPVQATVADFWTMIWEKSVELVVCLLTDAELDTPAYWPSEKGQDLEVAKLRISLQGRNLRGAWTERVLSLQDQDRKLTRVVIHLQLMSWPGSSFPSSPAQFVSLVNESITLYKQQRSLAHHIVVHCSAGIGRSGLFCLLLLAITHINSGKGIPDLVNLAANISSCRKNLLRDREHFKFAHQCVLYYTQDLLMKRGVLSRTNMEDKRPKTHSRIPSQDFLHSVGGASNAPYTMDYTGLEDSSSNKKGHSRKSSSSSICSSSNKAEMFSSQVGALDKLSTLSTPQDPLSQIDPLWPIKKEKEPTN